MTRIKRRVKPVWHECEALDRQSGRSFVVSETPAALLIRLKGTRTTLELPWSVAYLRAATLAAALAALQKANKRRASITRGRV